ncbi:MAG: hypothetical protein P4L59_01815 [Desulfosporosinus sp.]|nr:hypothetical protein [Desulfosporosinus sp.]
MKIFLKKIRSRTLFSLLDPVRVESLELCYLQALSDNLSIESFVIDDLFGLTEPQGIRPQAVVLTGYNTAEREILKEAEVYKKVYPEAKIIVGGLHVELNRESFRRHDIDFVIHSQDLSVLENVLQFVRGDLLELPSAGVDIRIVAEDGSDLWREGTRSVVDTPPMIRPNRKLTSLVCDRTRYLDKKTVALVKSRIGCPYQCDFCYCKLINGGVHVKSDYHELLRDVLEIRANYHWLVDDVFLASRQDALDYLQAYEELTKAEGEPRISLIAYLRADFIVKERDLLGKLKACGLDEVIVGFEATGNCELEEYNKQTNALDYPKAIELLREHDIELTALFIVRPDYGLGDFSKLNRFIVSNRIDTYTISILTPIKGTKNYQDVSSQLVTNDPKKFDFLHLVLEPRLPRTVFYLLFYSLHLRMLKSRRIRTYLWQLLSEVKS